MNLSIKNLTSLLLSCAMLMVLPVSKAVSAELNVPGFSGTVNTTVTSGFTVRASERNCKLQDGYAATASASDFSAAGQALIAAETDLTLAQGLLSNVTKNAEYSGSCATFQTDGYGNTSTNRLEYGNVNNDNGNLNFDRGDFVDATQKAFVEVSGVTDSGIGVDLSFITNVNPVLDLNDPNFINLTSTAQDELESDFALLDAYITTSFDTGSDMGFVDVTAGRYVTSWGEATFIPVGLNGLVTNALDLSKLRAPGSSIRDALLPTEQITLSFGSGDWGFEVYSQFNSERIAIDPKGSFFGNDVAGTGGDRILASGAFANEVAHEASCPYAAIALSGGAFTECNKTLHDYTLAPATRHVWNDAYNALEAFKGASISNWTYWTGTALATNHGRAFQSLVGSSPTFAQVDSTLAAFTTQGATNLAGLRSVYNGIRAVDYSKAATVELQVADQKHVEARNDGQWGVRASTYLEDVGTGVDLGFYYANYHSKLPYTQIMGKSGVLAGDIIGAYTNLFYDFAGVQAAGGGLPGVLDAGNQHQGNNVGNHLLVPFLNGAYGGGICAGLGAALGASTIAGDVDSELAKAVYSNLQYKKYIDGVGKVHDPTTCSAANTLSGTDYQSIFLSLTPTLAAAVTPLNYAQYRFIYPEDNQIFGLSFNTNLEGTTIQGEVSYRPDFPLATSAADQINQIADAAGTTLALTAFGHDTYALSPSNVTPGLTLPNLVNTLATAGTISKDFSTLLKAAQRSSLPVIDSSLVKVYDGTTYYGSTPFIRHDVFSVDIGTTTSFSASHPITKQLGADSSVLLTEVAMVHIDGMDNIRNGFVARNGFNEGSGEHLCLGIFRGLSSAEIAAVNTAYAAQSGITSAMLIDHDLSSAGGVSNVGASIVDAVFGNGSYCESQMGATETSLSYRVLGSATYNNFNNSRWSLTPTVVWSHDPSGYGPSSLGGFVEDRMSLSLGVTAARGDGLSASVNYVDQLGDEKANLSNDMDYLSASVTYAF